MTKKKLIDADILKNKISKWLDEIKSDRNKGEACEIYEADGAIEALETVIVEIEEMSTTNDSESNVGKWILTADVQPVNQWISVKDRLPDKDGDYLCYLECGVVCQSTFDSTIASDGEKFPFGEWIGVYDSNTLGFVDSRWEEHDAITHWMSLPEPPKDGDTE